jgi:ubiquinone/menaquinone biosynthesis C-methylase UbiE
VQRQPEPGKNYRIFLAFSALRDFINPPARTLADVGIRAGAVVLDFGCGRGGYAIAAARLAGPAGKVYAVDAHPLAVASTARKVRRRRLANVEVLRADGPLPPADGTVDVVLLYDVFHGLAAPGPILAEFARVLKPAGVLSVTDHHLAAEDIVAGVTAGAVFEFSRETKATLEFARRKR